jgi:hypothetical protein
MKFKILLLNSSHDRETTGFNSATDYVQAIVSACHDSLSASGTTTTATTMETESWTQYITHLVYLQGCQIDVDPPELKKRGIECVKIWPGRDGMVYESNVLERVLTGICSGRGGGLQRRATVQNYPIR